MPLPPLPEVDVVLRDGSGRSARGRLLVTEVGAEEGRVCVGFPCDAAPALEIGAEVEVELCEPGSQSIARTRAHVTQHRKGPRACHVHLELGEHGRGLLALYANRRRSLRVRPSVAAPIEVRISTLDQRAGVEGRVRDLSENGVGLLVRRPEDALVIAAERLLLSFDLPGDGRPFELCAALQVRRRAGAFVHYGLEFDPERSTDFDAQQARLAAWVVARQVSSPGAQPA